MELRQEKRLVIFKKIVIQIVALISALVLLAVPASATEYGLEWQFYLGSGSGSTSFGGVYFYTYNYNEGKYNYYPTLYENNGRSFRGLSIDKKYTTVAAIFNRPVVATDLQNILGDSTEKFYIEFPVYVEFGDYKDGAEYFNGNFEVYLSQLNLMINEDLETVNYKVDLSIEGNKFSDKLVGQQFVVGFTIVPTSPVLDIEQISFNFDVAKQTDNYYIQIAPNGPIKIKTGENIPVDAPEAEELAGDILDAIPVDNDGLVNALENFGGAMMHNTTECSWKVPSIMFPKIEGVSDGTAQLVPEMDIDFEEYAGLIPEDIMTLIQALTTVALIGYCIYELYGMIEYVMTMRKGGGSE